MTKEELEAFERAVKSEVDVYFEVRSQDTIFVEGVFSLHELRDLCRVILRESEWR